MSWWIRGFVFWCHEQVTYQQISLTHLHVNLCPFFSFYPFFYAHISIWPHPPTMSGNISIRPSPPNQPFCFHNIRMIPTKDSDQQSQSRQLRLRLSDLGWEQVPSNIADWTQVASIDLTSNPLECDCKLLWLKDLLSSIEAIHSVRILIYSFQKWGS